MSDVGASERLAFSAPPWWRSGWPADGPAPSAASAGLPSLVAEFGCADPAGF
jgi:hypothetical protein